MLTIASSVFAPVSQAIALRVIRSCRLGYHYHVASRYCTVMAATPPVKVAVICEDVSEQDCHTLSSRLQQRFEPNHCFTVDCFSDARDSDTLVAVLRDTDVLVADQNVFARNARDILAAGDRLRWVQSTFAGVDKVVSAMNSLGVERLPFTLTRCGGIFGIHMAEYIVGQIISHERQFRKMWSNQTNGIWTKKPFHEYRLLNTLSIGILGVGDIGREVARVCKAHGMIVWGLTRRQESTCPHIDYHRLMADLPELLGSCDYVCNILPSTSQTRGVLCGDMLQHCATKRSVFINIGRGDVTSEDSIVRAVRENWIRGAILDVFEKEPLTPDSPLWNMPEVVISPHVSAVTMIDEFADVFVENMELYLSGRPLKFTVDIANEY